MSIKYMELGVVDASHLSGVKWRGRGGTCGFCLAYVGWRKEQVVYHCKFLWIFLVFVELYFTSSKFPLGVLTSQ
jgi:hypothetical protein